MYDITDLSLLLMLMGIGAFAGLLAGLLGVGGGIVLVPAFFYCLQSLGYDGVELMQICLATSLATIVVTSMRSLHAHNKRGAVQWSILRTWSPGIILGAVFGVLVVARLRSETLQMIFGILGLLIGCYMIFGRQNWRLAQQMPKGIWRLLLSPIVGFLSVLMGIGGGSFGVPIMTLCGVPIHRAVATASGFGLIIALPAVIGFLFSDVQMQTPPFTIGAVNFGAFGAVVLMTIITAPMGAKLAHGLEQKPLKRIFGGFLIIVALNMLRKVLF